MEIASLVVAALAVAVAAWSLAYARGANVRADIANSHAQEALDLQTRVDARQREFRDVFWAFSWSPWTPAGEKPEIQMTNGGLTAAHDVSLILSLPTSHQVIRLGTFQPRETKTVPIEYDRTGPGANHIELVRDMLYHVRWSSPLGHPDETKMMSSRRAQSSGSSA